MISDLKFAVGVEIKSMNVRTGQFFAYSPDTMLHYLLRNRQVCWKRWTIFIDQEDKVFSFGRLPIRRSLCRGQSGNNDLFNLKRTGALRALTLVLLAYHSMGRTNVIYIDSIKEEGYCYCQYKYIGQSSIQ